MKTLDEFDFTFQPSVDQRLIRELAAGHFMAHAENVLIFGPPGVGKTHLAIALGHAAVETGHSVLFTSATALLAALATAETEGQLAERLTYYTKPKLLVSTSSAICRSSAEAPTCSFSSSPDATSAGACSSPLTSW